MKRDLELKKLYEKITESKVGAPIKSEHDKAMFERLIKNQMGYLKEDTFSGDISRIGEILVPVFRRAFPQLIAKEIVGVQPLSQPSGHVFALRYHYKGNQLMQGQPGGSIVGGGQNGIGYQLSGLSQTLNQANSVIVIYTSKAAKEADIGLSANQEIGPGASAAGTSAFLNNGGDAGFGTGSGDVLYTEGVAALVKISNSDLTTALALNTASFTGSTIASVIYNEAGYVALNIFKGLSGQFATDAAELKGDDIEELGMTIEKILVEAKSRKLRASYTVEAAQDLKSIHGKDLAAELIDILTYEITQSIDRDLIAKIKTAAQDKGDFDVLATGNDGRWTIEKYRNAYTELIRQSNDIAKTTLRGPGNFLVVDADVATMLETIPGYIHAPILGGGDPNTNSPVNSMGHALIGSMGGRFKVYRDIFSTGSNTVVGYKGPSEYDTGVIWSPYIPLTMTKVVRQESGQPRIIFSERSAISETPFSSDGYYRTINFTNIFPALT